MHDTVSFLNRAQTLAPARKRAAARFVQQPFVYAFVRGSERSSDLLLQGLAHDVAVGQSGVEAHAVCLLYTSDAADE